MLPDAALRFKQKAGRLIRSEEDRGLLIVLDGRLNSRWYGSYFKDSIPIQNHLVVEKQKVFPLLKEWFGADH
jgi:ATP-dependent DNA helicase DinG